MACLGPVGLALLAPAVASAAPADPVADAAAAARVELRSVGSPPSVAAPGSSFTINGRVANQTRRSIRPRVKITLRTSKSAAARLTATKTLARLKARRTAGYSVKVTLPSRLAQGRYYVRACADTGKGAAAACRFATKRLTVRKPATPPAATRPTAPPAATQPTTPSHGGGTTTLPSTPPSGGDEKPLPQPDPEDTPDFDVLAFTKNASVDTRDAVRALRDAGKDSSFGVTATDNANVFTNGRLDDFKAVIFVNNTGDILTDAQQAAFEAYYRDGGGFIAIGSAVTAEPDWDFYGELIGTRAAATNSVSGEAKATIKVADRVHDATKSLPEYWQHTDRYYNFADNVRGESHVLATVDENTYSGGTMKTLADHPISWCKDWEGGRSFYTGTGANGDFSDAQLGKHLTGAIQWAAGLSDPVYSDCGATVLANYEQTKISAPPNLNEPIGFDQLPDGRVIQTARTGEVRLHEPNGSEITLAKLNVYTNSEDGLYGPAIDPDFATNKWVYLYYAPPTVRIRKCDGTLADVTTPTGSAPTVGSDPCVWQDTWQGYFQLSRFKFVDREGDEQPHLDLASEQKILQVPNNRGACCHVAGDIDFDTDGNLWMVTGDDTPAGGGNSGGFSPHNDMITDEFQALRVANATGGTFTLTFNGQTTGAIPYNATAAQIEAALLELPNVRPNEVTVSGNNNVLTANQTVAFGGDYSRQNVPTLVANSSLEGNNPTVTVTTSQEAGLYNTPHVDARRTSYNTNDLRGKVLRIKVKSGDITADEANRNGGAYTVPSGNLFPSGDPLARPEIYAMGFRNPFRIQVDDQGVAYVTDYSPDSQVPQDYRGPAGTGRVEIIRKPANYGWPLCYSPALPYYKWNFNTSRPLDPDNPTAYDCGNPNRGPANTSRWNTGRTYPPAITQPDIWYSYRDNQNPPLGTPCLAYYDGSRGKCPQLFPELFTGGVAPHGAAPYRYDPDSPSETKFPPYWDGAFVFGEFGQDTLREVRFDSDGKIFKINQTLNCGAALVTTTFPFECDNPMDMQFGADGNFYLLTYGDGFFNANPDAGMYKWSYTKGPQAPTAAISATPTSGVAPLTVQFSSEGSSDPDEGDSIRYAWDFDGNGTVDSIEENPSHVYTANGVYQAKLTVTDSAGKSDTKSTTITVGNTAPTVTLTVPTEGDFFEFGQRIPYTVTVTDPQDGTIDCNRVTVTFVLVHDTHGHGEDSRTGCTGFVQSLAEDASHGGYLAGGIVATYTDTGGGGQPALTGRAETLVQVKRQELEFAQRISGTTTAGITDEGASGAAATSLDPGDWIALNNRFNLQNMDKSITFRYAGGSATNPAGADRMKVEIRTGSPTGPVVTEVTLKSTGTNNTTYTSQTFPLNYTGTQDLYLVFRATGATGAPTAAMGLINWVGFTGPGIGTT